MKAVTDVIGIARSNLRTDTRLPSCSVTIVARLFGKVEPGSRLPGSARAASKCLRSASRPARRE